MKSVHEIQENLKLMFSLKNYIVSEIIVIHLPRFTWFQVCYPIYKQLPWREHLPLVSSSHHQAE